MWYLTKSDPIMVYWETRKQANLAKKGEALISEIKYIAIEDRIRFINVRENCGKNKQSKLTEITNNCKNRATSIWKSRREETVLNRMWFGNYLSNFLQV